MAQLEKVMYFPASIKVYQYGNQNLMTVVGLMAYVAREMPLINSV